jgi:hypothetical protein
MTVTQWSQAQRMEEAIEQVKLMQTELQEHKHTLDAVARVITDGIDQAMWKVDASAKEQLKQQGDEQTQRVNQLEEIMGKRCAQLEETVFQRMKMMSESHKEELGDMEVKYEEMERRLTARVIAVERVAIRLQGQVNQARAPAPAMAPAPAPPPAPAPLPVQQAPAAGAAAFPPPAPQQAPAAVAAAFPPPPQPVWGTPPAAQPAAQGPPAAWGAPQAAWGQAPAAVAAAFPPPPQPAWGTPPAAQPAAQGPPAAWGAPQAAWGPPGLPGASNGNGMPGAGNGNALGISAADRSQPLSAIGDDKGRAPFDDELEEWEQVVIDPQSGARAIVCRMCPGNRQGDAKTIWWRTTRSEHETSSSHMKRVDLFNGDKPYYRWQYKFPVR